MSIEVVITYPDKSILTHGARSMQEAEEIAYVAINHALKIQIKGGNFPSLEETIAAAVRQIARMPASEIPHHRWWVTKYDRDHGWGIVFCGCVGFNRRIALDL